MDKRPHAAVIDLEATFTQFLDQTPQGKGAAMAAFQQPVPPGTGDLLRAMAAHLAGRNQTLLAPAPRPPDRGADAHAKAPRRFAPR
jgi:hypothetical protein